MAEPSFMALMVIMVIMVRSGASDQGNAFSMRSDVPTSPPNCYTISSSDLSFCTMMIGTEIDSFFGEKSPTWNGQNFPQYADQVIQQVFKQNVDPINSNANYWGYAVCESCITQLKWLLCGGIFPRCGYYECLQGILFTVFYNGCPQLCQCTNCDDLRYPGQNCTLNSLYNATTSGNCDWYGLGLQYSNAVATSNCGVSILSKNHCMQFVDACSCQTANAESICSVDYPANGFNLTNWPTGSCSSTQNWCNSPQPNSEGAICPNSNLCIMTPPPLGSKATSQGTTGVSALSFSVSSLMYVTTVSTASVLSSSFALFILSSILLSTFLP